MHLTFRRNILETLEYHSAGFLELCAMVTYLDNKQYDRILRIVHAERD